MCYIGTVEYGGNIVLKNLVGEKQMSEIGVDNTHILCWSEFTV